MRNNQKQAQGTMQAALLQGMSGPRGGEEGRAGSLEEWEQQRARQVAREVSLCYAIRKAELGDFWYAPRFKFRRDVLIKRGLVTPREMLVRRRGEVAS